MKNKGRFILYDNNNEFEYTKTKSDINKKINATRLNLILISDLFFVYSNSLLLSYKINLPLFFINFS